MPLSFTADDLAPSLPCHNPRLPHYPDDAPSPEAEVRVDILLATLDALSSASQYSSPASCSSPLSGFPLAVPAPEKPHHPLLPASILSAPHAQNSWTPQCGAALNSWPSLELKTPNSQQITQNLIAQDESLLQQRLHSLNQQHQTQYQHQLLELTQSSPIRSQSSAIHSETSTPPPLPLPPTSSPSSLAVEDTPICKSRRARSTRSRTTPPTPSRHCHICARTKSSYKVSCRNFYTNRKCKKVVCEPCFNEYNWDFHRAKQQRDWLCPHCSGTCHSVDKARCHIYTKTNARRRERTKDTSC